MNRATVDRYTGPTVKGIDVSRYQARVDYGAVKADGYEFVFIRTGDGQDEDTRFADHAKRARAAGLRLGFYRYLRADRNGEDQARADLALLDAIGGFQPGDLSIAGDIEHGIAKDLRGGEFDDADHDGDGHPDDLTAKGEIKTHLWLAEALEYMTALDDGLRDRGQRRFLLVYTGQFFHHLVSQVHNLRKEAEAFSKYGLWVPSYGTRFPRMPVDRNGKGFPWPHYTIHQVTGHGRVDGIPGDVDINVFRGSLKELDALWSSASKVA